MATKKNKKIIYNIDELFKEYSSYISLIADGKKDISRKIEELEIEIADLTAKADVAKKEVEALTTDTKASDVASREMLSAIENLNLFEEYIESHKSYIELKDKVDTFKYDDETEKSLDEKDLADLDKFLKDYTGKITPILLDYQTRYGKIKLDELIAKENERIEDLSNIVDAKKALEALLQEIEKKQEEKAKAIEEKNSTSTADSLENFEKFLSSQNLPVIHAEEIYNYHNDPISNPLLVGDDSIKIRKTHPKRDATLKKGVLPTAVTASAIGGFVGGIAGSSLPYGSTVLGIIPVTTTPGLTAIATATLGVGVGLIATPVIIFAKNKLTKLHYALWYGNAQKNLKAYEATDIEDLKICKLLQRIDKTQNKIYEMEQGNWFTKAVKFLPKYVLNKVNRNRTHKIQADTKSLLSIYSKIANSDLEDSEKLTQLKPVRELLQHIENFVIKQTTKSKLKAMLTCKTDKKGHVHDKALHELADIFGAMKIYVDTVGLAVDKDEKTRKKQAQANIKNIDSKKRAAKSVVNNERLISKMLEGYESKLAPKDKSIPVASTTYNPTDDSVIVTLKNGKSVTLNNKDITSYENIETIKTTKTKTIITYTDGTTTEIAKAVKIIPEIETTRRVLYSKLINDVEFVNELKATYDIRTINALANSLKEWFNDTTKKLKLSGNAKKLYNDALDALNVVGIVA